MPYKIWVQLEYVSDCDEHEPYNFGEPITFDTFDCYEDALRTMLTAVRWQSPDSLTERENETLDKLKSDERECKT